MTKEEFRKLTETDAYSGRGNRIQSDGERYAARYLHRDMGH